MDQKQSKPQNAMKDPKQQDCEQQAAMKGNRNESGVITNADCDCGTKDSSGKPSSTKKS